MVLKAIIIDASGTILDSYGRVSPGVQDLLNFCRINNLRIAVNSNQDAVLAAFKNTGLPYDLLVGRGDVGKPKPSPLFVGRVKDVFAVQSNELVYIGDDDRTDAFCAANAKVLYLSARWSKPQSQYGIPMTDATKVQTFLKCFLLKQHSWALDLEEEDGSFRPANLNTLIAHYDGLPGWVWSAVKEALKVTSSQNSRYLLFQLIVSLYFSGFHEEFDIIATYPSSKQGSSINPIMSSYLALFSQEFRNKYEDLFLRHKNALDSGQTRKFGDRSTIDFMNQIETVHLNPAMQGRLDGKSVLVIDDFTTKGYSFDCARNLLLQTGVAGIRSVAIGKFTGPYCLNSPAFGGTFDPFGPVTGVPFSEVSRWVEMEDGKDATNEVIQLWPDYLTNTI